MSDSMAVFYSSFKGPGNLYFDIGANVGNRTRVFLDLGVNVVAVEPQPGCQEVLLQQFKDRPGFTLIPYALGSSEGQAEMIVSDAHTISSMNKEWIQTMRNSGRFGHYNWYQPITVPVIRLDTLIAQYGMPDFCKIDVEGYEMQVFRGLSKPIPALSFEFSDEVMTSTLSCIRYLESLGRYRFNLSLGESLAFHYDSWCSAEEMCERMGGLKADLLWGDIYAVRL
jgi:FkbM family methyltransferase